MDEPKYRRLLGRALPVVIRTDAEYRRQLGIAKKIMEKPEEEICEEEGRLLELLGVLIEEYEERAYPLPLVTRRAIAELEAGKGKKFASVADLLADLKPR